MIATWEECNDPRELLRQSEQHLKQERFRWLAAEYVEQIRGSGCFCPQIDHYWTTQFLSWVRGVDSDPFGVRLSMDFDGFPETFGVRHVYEAIFKYMQTRQWAQVAINTFTSVEMQARSYEPLITQGHQPKSKTKLAKHKAEEEARHQAWRDSIDTRLLSIKEAFCNSYRDVAGNPFEPVEFEPRWRTDTVMALARGIHAEAAFDRMPILADAMEEVGCNHPTILSHCRNQQLHVRGCWVISEVFEDQWE